MIEVLILLIAAHLIADFPLQTDWMISKKKKPFILCLHVLLVGIVTTVLIGSLPIVLLPILLTTHLIMDAVKVYKMDDKFNAFVLDQAVHFFVIFGLAWHFHSLMPKSVWQNFLSPDEYKWYLQSLVLISVFIAGLPMGGIIIQKATERFDSQIKAERSKRKTLSDDEGLTDGGRFIGYLERALILILVLAGQAGGVGFLIAAKSILRFGEIKDSSQRKMSEYIIIGTFMSFGWALLVGFTGREAVKFLG